MGTGHYDRSGIPLDDKAGMAEFGKNRTVVFTRITAGTPPRVWEVSTVHLVIDHNHSRDGAPVIFETMVFDPDDNGGECERWCTEREAREGHVRMVVEVSAGLSRSVVMDLDVDELHEQRRRAGIL